MRRLQDAFDIVGDTNELDRSDDARMLHSDSVLTRRLLIVAIVAICLGGPVAEIFDRWDQTAKDGNDTEANMVLAALCVGAAVAVARSVAARFCVRSPDSRVSRVVFRLLTSIPRSLRSPSPHGSPPTPLRV